MRNGHRKQWTPDEDDRLREMIIAKASITLMSAKLKRSAVAIRMRIIALGGRFGQCSSLKVENDSEGRKIARAIQKR